LPTVSITTSNRSSIDDRSADVWSTTWEAPNDSTNAAFGALVTPVTVAPKCRASCTALVPTAPDAPLTSRVAPGARDALSRRKCSAVVPPKSTPAACSWLTSGGFRTARAADTARSSAWVPIFVPLMPHTSSPMARPATSDPTLSTTPEKVPPSTARRGRVTPKARRANGAKPFGKRAPRMRASPDVTAAASTRTSTSPAFGSGRGTSRTFTTSGSPYRSTTAARTPALLTLTARSPAR
jgi:hypothetical protein